MARRGNGRGRGLPGRGAGEPRPRFTVCSETRRRRLVGRKPGTLLLFLLLLLGRDGRLRHPRGDCYPRDAAGGKARHGLRLEPSITGAKAGETFVLAEDGPEVICP